MVITPWLLWIQLCVSARLPQNNTQKNNVNTYELLSALNRGHNSFANWQQVVTVSCILSGLERSDAVTGIRISISISISISQYDELLKRSCLIHKVLFWPCVVWKNTGLRLVMQEKRPGRCFSTGVSQMQFGSSPGEKWWHSWKEQCHVGAASADKDDREETPRTLSRQPCGSQVGTRRVWGGGATGPHPGEAGQWLSISTSWPYTGESPADSNTFSV